MVEPGPPQLHIDGPQAVITLRRPAVANRLERADLDLLLRHLHTVDHAPQVRVLRLQSQGRHFCSGFNLQELIAEAGLSQEAGEAPLPSGRAVESSLALSPPSHFAQVADALERARPVTVAVVQGGVYGGATDLALACDLRVGTPDIELSVPAVRLGLQFYRTGLQRAVQRLGWPTAQRIFLLGHTLKAEDLVLCGWMTEMAPTADALQAQADALCDHLLSLAPLALLGVKQALNAAASGRTALPEVQQALDAASAVTEQSQDLREGIHAWREGRPPRFLGG